MIEVDNIWGCLDRHVDGRLVVDTCHMRRDQDVLEPKQRVPRGGWVEC